MKLKETTIKKYILKATIPISRFANLKPEIELETDNITEAQELALKHIQKLYKYSSEPIQEIKKREILKSFNENAEIEFERERHKYFYKSIPLLSATAYTKQFYPEFNAEVVAKNCELKWGVNAQDIQDMWASNGNIAGEFGTIIHKTLEHYFKFKEIGKIIQKNTGKEVNPALPKHPFLRMIIEDFEALYPHNDELKTEVFISDVKNGRCGIIDRLLVTGKKTCRIQDYKVNVNSEEENLSLKVKIPYNKLPPTKLTKYQIQMSFYARILENSGWKVEGLDAFVYENVWKHYKLPILKL